MHHKCQCTTNRGERCCDKPHPSSGGRLFAVSLYGYAHERLRLVVESVDVPISGLPSALDGLRIVQLSDIHAGDFMPLHEVRRAVSMANELQSHLAVITGDFVTSWGDPLAGCIHELSLLRAPLGTFGCNGNHEIYAGAEDDAEALFAANGMRLLRHAATHLEWNGSPLNLIGIDYQHNVPMTGKTMPTLNGAELLVRGDMPNILLSHNPNTFPSAAAAGVELSLAGHTHGGQVNVEILHRSLNPARFFTHFIAGTYRMLQSNNKGQARLYVNRGLGTLGFPARIASRPEITLLTLRSNSSG
jgi:predicted MPP superfamily phosphohydrolase